MKKISIIIILIIVLSFSFLFKKKKNNNPYVCEDCNLIVISLSNLRKVNMPLYGYARNTTPNINNFFSNSIVFNNAISPASLTFTDYISLFFSLQPNRHKFMNRSDRETSSKILEDYKSLPYILKNKGYKTAAFVSDEDYAYKNNLGSQFELYFDKKNYPDYQIKFKNWEYGVGTKDLVKPAMDWLNENYKKKFFMFLQAYDMHCPYTPNDFYKVKYSSPHSDKINFSDCYITLKEVEKIKKNKKEYYKLYNWKSFLDQTHDEGELFSNDDIEYLKNLYDAELENADSNLVPLFKKIEELNLNKNTIIVFMSEHGDYLGETDFFMKASVLPRGNLHNVNLGFPLLLKLPNLNKMIKQDQIFQAIDFAPTLLELLGIDKDKKMQGMSHLSVIGTDKKINDYAYSYCLRKRDYLDTGSFLVESIQDKKWKLDNFEHFDFDGKIIEKKQYLYDLAVDQDEKNNLVGKNNEVVELLNQKREIKRKEYE